MKELETRVSHPAPRGEGPTHRSDLLVLGGGSGAFAAAIRAAELGAKVTMVERATMGGTCVNVGCVPSKTLIRAADVHHLRSHHPFAGIPTDNGGVDLAALTAQKAELVARLRGTKYRDVLASYDGIEYLVGEARFVDERSVVVTSRERPVRRLDAERIVVATGASPWVPAIPGIEDTPFWTNVEALSARVVPEMLVVAGGGPVGLELAQLYARLGSRVTLYAPTLAPGTDPEVGEAVRDAFEAEGIDVRTGARLAALGRTESGVRIVAEVEGHEESRVADQVLIATGRRGNTRELDLERAGVEVDDRGFVQVDSRLRSSRDGLYAVGDCTNLPMFVYVAAKAGTIAAENAISGVGAELDLSAMPAVVFTDPQLAWVGLTETAALERGLDVITRTLPMGEVPRALANRDGRGLIKLVARRGDGRLLGAQLVSPAAGEAIQTAVLAVKSGLTVADLADTLFPYLTEVEGIRLAAQTFERSLARLSCCAG